MNPKKTIALAALRCPECGAPAEVPAGADTYHCRFCHAALLIEREVAELPPRPPPAAFPLHDAAPRIATVGAAPPTAQSSGAAIAVAIGAFVLVGVVVLVIALAGSPFGSWNGKHPLVCSGNDTIFVDHVTATFASGVAIDASGNCMISCTDCRLSAPTVIRARENAWVSLNHGSADGKVFADTRDFGNVSIDHTKTTGTTLNAHHESRSSEPPPWPKSGPFYCDGTISKTYDHVKIKVASGPAILGAVNCSLKLSHCVIEGPVGLLLRDNASVELDQCEVHATDGVIAKANGEVTLEGGTFVGSDHAVRLVDNAHLRAHGAAVRGSKSTVGNAAVDIQ